MTRKTSDIIIHALVARIRELETTVPGAASDPRAIIDRLVARGEVEYFKHEDDPLAQNSFRPSR